MMKSLIGMMNEHIITLGNEVEPSINLQGLECEDLQAQVAVMGSAGPLKDVETIQWLFPQKFKSETGKESIVLFEKDDNNNIGLTLMIVDCRTSGKCVPIHWKNATVILEEKEIILAVERCRGKGASLIFRDSFQVARGVNTTLAVIRLSGGANLVMMSAPFLHTHLGRQQFCAFVTSRDNIQSLDRERASNVFDEDYLLNDLESEFDRRFRRLEGSAESSMTSEASTQLDGGSSSAGGAGIAAVVPARNFPTLGLSLLRKHDFLQHDIPINSRNPIPFETDLFQGKLQLLIRPKDPTDDRYHHNLVFSKTKVKFIIQIQGKFKYVPNGVVYAGIELNHEMNPPLLMKGLSTVILRHIRKHLPSLHHSFGSKLEKPHLVAPAMSFFDRFVITKEGALPPSIMSPLHETAASIEARKASKSTGTWDKDTVYSFACMTEYIDLPYWQLVGLEFMRDTDLCNLWGESALRLVMYEHRENDHRAHHVQHCHYLFALQIQHLGDVLEAAQKRKDLLDIEHESSLTWGRIKKSVLRDALYQAGSDQAHYEEKTVGDCDEESTTGELVDHSFLDLERAPLPAMDILKAANECCPGWIDAIDSTSGKYTRVYAFVASRGLPPVFRTTKQFKSYIIPKDAAKEVRSKSSPRISQSELHRRVMGVAFAEVTKKRSIQGRQLKSAKCDVDKKFLDADGSRPEPLSMKTTVLKTSYVARALSERHWREELVRLFDDHIAFFRPDSLTPESRVYLSAVVEIKKVKKEVAPNFPGFYFLVIRELGRSVYLMFASMQKRDEWFESMNKIVESLQTDDSMCNVYTQIDDPSHQFLHNSSIWDCRERRVLNSRRYRFHTVESGENPSELVEKAMIAAQEAQKDTCRKTLLKFLDSIGAINGINIYGLEEDEKTAFFLNLYHLMIMHCYLLLGPPENAYKATKMYRMVSYQMSDDIFSLYELEHNIIRNSTCFPSSIGAKLSLPKSTFDFAMTTTDRRLNFAINRGCLGQPPVTQVFKADTLDRQFDMATKLYMNEMKVGKEDDKIVVQLPRLFLWYEDDFGSRSDLIEFIARHADADQQVMLSKVEDEKTIIVKFLQFDSKCRHLRLEQSEMVDVPLIEGEEHSYGESYKFDDSFSSRNNGRTMGFRLSAFT